MMRAAFLVLALVAAAACDGGPTAARTPGHNPGSVQIRKTGTASATAQGAYSIVFGSNTEDISFLVSNSGSSVTSGWAMFYSHNAGVVAYISVSCLYVSNHVATFLGSVVASNDGTIVGDDAYWQVVDNSPDESSLVSLASAGNGPSCTTPGEFDLVNISSGGLTVS
jgi:hypothetical protein